jgi:hypothetical protein
MSAAVGRDAEKCNFQALTRFRAARRNRGPPTPVADVPAAEGSSGS